MFQIMNFEFEPFIIYEFICCTKFPGTEIVNAACIGGHFTPFHEVFFHVYDDTDTRKNLTEGTRFSLNISEDFYDYVLAALNGWHAGPGSPEFPVESYEQSSTVPLLKSAWLQVICEVIPNPPELATCKQKKRPNVRAKILEIKIKRMPKIIMNRAFNLAIEALVITTRAPLVELYSPKYYDHLKFYRAIKEKIREWGVWESYAKGFEVMDSFLLKNNVKSSDLFNF
jgi:hypothetical protein